MKSKEKDEKKEILSLRQDFSGKVSRKEQKEKERLIKSTKMFADMGEIESFVYTRGTRVRKMIRQNGDWVWEDDTTYYVDQTEMEKKFLLPEGRRKRWR